MARGNHDCNTLKANYKFENDKVKIVFTNNKIKSIKKSKKTTIIVSHIPADSLKGKADYVFFGHEHVKNTKNFIPALTLNGGCNVRYLKF
jgi:predicted phosphodiesterase